jgi:hypothetical protein
MPNYCNNTITVVGEANELLDFLYWVRIDGCNTDDESVYDFTKLHPTPDALASTVSGWYAEGSPEKEAHEKKQAENIVMYGYKDWYDWNIANWGTKWSPADVYQNLITRNCAEFSYQTAWSPCSPLWQNISNLYPTLAFIETYEEMGMGFYGLTAHYRGGQFFESFIDIANSEDEKWIDIFNKMSKDDTGEVHYEMEELVQEEIGKMLEEALLSLPAPVKLSKQTQTQ